MNIFRLVEKQRLEIESLRAKLAQPTPSQSEPVGEIACGEIDAACFRFWVSEAARNPSSMAMLIAKCTTEQEYRDAIMPLVIGAQSVINKAKG